MVNNCSIPFQRENRFLKSIFFNPQVASDCRIGNRSKEPQPRSASNFALAAFTGCKRRRRIDLRSEQNANGTGACYLCF